MTAKFKVGNRVKFNHRELAILTGKVKRHSYKDYLYMPDPESLNLITRRRSRKIVKIVYSPELQANLYYLGSNHHGKSDPLSTIAFRSYQLVLVTEPNRIGRPREHRKYTRWQNE